jgi:hypothetical protein
VSPELALLWEVCAGTDVLVRPLLHELQASVESHAQLVRAADGDGDDAGGADWAETVDRVFGLWEQLSRGKRAHAVHSGSTRGD